jgi:hypothetical protein
VCLYVCDQDTPKRETKGPPWTISACGWMDELWCERCAQMTQDRAKWRAAVKTVMNLFIVYPVSKLLQSDIWGRQYDLSRS